MPLSSIIPIIIISNIKLMEINYEVNQNTFGRKTQRLS